MSDYISREAALNAICNRCDAKRVFGCSIEIMPCGDLKALKAIPAADVRPVVPGKWEKKYADIPYACSICGYETRETVLGKPRLNFCHNCGAEMKEGE